MIQTIIDWLVSTIAMFGYSGVFIAVFLLNLFAPIPSVLILPFTGFVASQGGMNIYLVIAIASFAAYLGSLPYYFLGRWGEKPLLKFLDKYGKYFFIEKSDVDLAFKLFDKYGNGLVLFGRLIPIARTLVSFPAGVAKMSIVLFSLFTFFGLMLWNTILIYTGYLFAGNWEIVAIWVDRYESIIILLLVLMCLLYIGGGIFRRLKARNK